MYWLKPPRRAAPVDRLKPDAEMRGHHHPVANLHRVAGGIFVDP